MGDEEREDCDGGDERASDAASARRCVCEDRGWIVRTAPAVGVGESAAVGFAGGVGRHV